MLESTSAHSGGVIAEKQSSSTLSAVLRIALPVMGIIAIGLAWYAAQIVVLDWLKPARLNTNLSPLQADVHPDTPIQVALTGYGAELSGVRLYRSDPAVSDQEQAVPVKATSTSERAWDIVTDEGLQPDSLPIARQRQ